MVNHKDKARYKWRYLLLNAGLNEKYLQYKGSDCPICLDGKDRYRFDDKDGHFGCLIASGTIPCNTSQVC